MTRYRKLPVEVDAFKWTGDQEQTDDPVWIVDAIREGKVSFRWGASAAVQMIIETLEGSMAASVGDYVIRGTKGEIYPCKPDIFEAIYEQVGA